MPRELPNLDWLRVFASTAATESFSTAAAQLSVTPGAVSQRIKALEGFLGIDLFQRYAQGVRLTDAGKRYAERVLPLLEQLALATREITSADVAKPVRISVLPALAQLWLGPRMEDFHRRDESAWIEIWADPAIVDLRTSNFDLALRHGKPPFPGCDSRAILFDEIAPVASPAVAARARIDEHGLPSDTPLMLDTYWSSDIDYWLQHAGSTRPANLAVQTFSLYSMTVEAVLNDRGFMIGHTTLVDSLVKQGRLQYLSEKRVPSSKQFYLLTKSGVTLSKSANAFMEWLLEQ